MNIVETYICEDYFTDYVVYNGGLVYTRKCNNLNSFDYTTENPLVCLTGYSTILKLFFESMIHKLNEGIRLIIIESDVINLKKEWLDNDKLQVCYSWNKPFSHPKLYCLPIGLNYHRQYITFKDWKNPNIQPKRLLAVNCTMNTNSIRGQLVVKAKQEWSFCDVLEFIPPLQTYWKDSYVEGKIKITVSSTECYNILSKYKFILSPPGAGEDTHRTWEALYVGCIPIVQSSSIDELYKDLPVLIVKDWSDINESMLEMAYLEICENKQKKKYNLEKLTFRYWIDQIDKRDIHFMTYGNNIFNDAKNRISQEAKLFNEFKSISVYGPDNIKKWVADKYQDILSQRRGGGYWLWRPFLVYEKMQSIKHNDIIVYTDAGCHLNPQGKKRFFEYIDMLKHSKYGILSFQMSGNNNIGSLCKEKVWTTRQIFEYFNIDEQNSEIKETGQYLGGVFILQKNKHSMNYLREFIKCIIKDKLLITDYYNNKNQASYFKDNRHDQSISSVLRKKIGSVVIDSDETWITPFGSEKSLMYPFWAMRSRK
jgi:hypothetical protein